MADSSIIILFSGKMIRFLIIFALSSGVVSCNKIDSAKSSALPENVKKDKPIILKEGQAVVIMKQGDKDLMIGAAIVDGELSIAEIDPSGRSFGVTWKNSELWETTTIFSDDDASVTIMDNNGDGIPDTRFVSRGGELEHYKLEEPHWFKIDPKKDREQNAAEQPATAPQSKLNENFNP